MNSAFPLHYAVSSQDIASLEQLIKSGINLEKADSNGCTALMVAIEKSNSEAAKLLIHYGAEVNTKNGKQESALVKAIKTRQTEIAKRLVERGADCTEELAKRNETVLTLAAWYRAYELFELMVVSVKQAQPGALKRLDWEGRNLLHRAIVDYQIEVTEILLRQGVNIEAAGKSNNRPLHTAAEYGRHEHLKLLLAYGANREAKNFDGRTALDFARLLKHEACIELLEAEPNAEAQKSDNSVVLSNEQEAASKRVCLQSQSSQAALSDEAWENIKSTVESSKMGRPRQSNLRKIIEGIVFKQATGCDWRSLPVQYGRWEAVYASYYRWKRAGVWEKVEEAIKS
jgi:ankyrin repeat protein